MPAIIALILPATFLQRLTVLPDAVYVIHDVSKSAGDTFPVYFPRPKHIVLKISIRRILFTLPAIPIIKRSVLPVIFQILNFRTSPVMPGIMYSTGTEYYPPPDTDAAGTVYWLRYK